MPSLSCPHCGFSKQLSADQMPRQRARITCPKCRQAFEFPPAADSRPDPSLVAVDCPHCGNHREVPREKIPPGFHELRCRKCGQGFTFNIADHPEPDAEPSAADPARDQEPGTAPAAAGAAGQAPPPLPPGELPPVIDLFGRTWQLYKKRVWVLIAIYLLTMVVPTVLVGIGAAVLLPLLAAVGNPGGLNLLLGFGAVLVVCLLISTGMGAMLFAVVDQSLGIRAAIAKGWDKVWAYGWLLFLIGLITTGGFLLLVIPGLIFMTWFFFAQYVLAEEDERGMDALLKSRAYVSGYFWGVLLRLLVLWVTAFLVSLVLGVIPILGGLAQLLLFPFTLLYPYLIFADIKRARGGEVVFANGGGTKARWLLAGIAGYLVLPLLFWLAGGPALVQNFMLQIYLQRHPGAQQVQVEPNWEQMVPIEDQIAKPLPPLQQVSKTQYHDLLARSNVSFRAGGGSLGPLAVKIDQFWQGSNAPHLWLKVRCANLPNLRLLGNRGLKVSIERVLGDGGSDQYDPQNPFEKELFQRVALSTDGQGLLEGNRDIYLRPGTAADEIRRIDGQIELTLPLAVESLKLTPSMMGETYRVAGRPVKFVTMRGGMVRLELPQGRQPLLRVIGYNVAGQPLVEGSTSWTGQEPTVLTQTFQGELFSVEVLMAGSLLQRSYPFSVSPEKPL